MSYFSALNMDPASLNYMLIKIKTRGYEPLLDYLKGISILMVLVSHGLGGLIKSYFIRYG